jgi:single-strand DNA-binding protein
MVNKVTLLGRLGSDPELRYTQNRTAVCTIKLATSDRRKSAEGEWTEHTEWHNVVAFGKTAENCNNYLKKGRMIYVDGKIQTRKYQDSDGKDKYWTEILAQTVQFINANKNEDSSSNSNPSNNSAPNANYSNEVNGSIGESVSFDDDDIPF